MEVDNDSADEILSRKLPQRKLLQRALVGDAAAGLVACESTDKTTQRAKQGADRQSRPAVTPLPDRSTSGTNAIVIVAGGSLLMSWGRVVFDFGFSEAS